MNQDDREAIRELLMGRRVVAVEMFDPTRLGDDYYVWATGKMTLDDGREVYVAPNEGCGGCTNGLYDLKSLERVDNIITRVDFQTTNTGDDIWEVNTTYRIFVFADNVQINLLTVEGSDGNGYYGTGYELIVKPVKENGQ